MFRKSGFVLLAVFILFLGGFVFNIFLSTGYFREITNRLPGEVLRTIDLPGVEDMQISYLDSFLILSSDDRAARRDGNPRQGHLYLIDLTDPSLTPQCLTTDLAIPFFPHGISLFRQGEQHYRVFAINHADDKESIEVFDLKNDSLSHLYTLLDEALIHPNDLVALDTNHLYVTNDHAYPSGWRRLAEDYLGLALSNVVYFDGNAWQEASSGIAYANGINRDPKRNLLFVASPRDFLVKVYQIGADHTLSWLEDIDCQTGVDNIELDPEGKLWIGCHPSLLTFSAYAKGKKPISPSEVITIDYRGKEDYTVASVFLDDGHLMSASTVAPPFGDLIFIGNVMDDHFLVLKIQ
ncbi:MAG: SMP-30/gluconolactonase/LRE family protein [Lewinellaceae bacterium]|nr:SMP-30/gluconolactonase/LRE family protein [Saprospiraceae bacterium]MCB9313808.1 SMP-30/gluconolactonase/LRE family protein [Lewinellaceae bacterium]